jgi:hypothetical protein
MQSQKELNLIFIKGLKQEEFLLYGQNHIAKLERSLAKAIKANGGACWLGDFQEPLYKYVREQFDSKIFLPNSGHNSLEKWAWYHKEEKPTLDEYLSSPEREKVVSESLFKRVKAALNRVTDAPREFKSAEVQGFFREYCLLEKEDSLEFLEPLINLENVASPNVLEVYNKLYSRRMISRERGSPVFPGDRYTFALFEKFLSGNIGEEIYSKERTTDKSDYSWEMEHLNYFCKSLQRHFRVLIANTRFVYTDKEMARRLIEEYTNPETETRKKVQVSMRI